MSEKVNEKDNRTLHKAEEGWEICIGRRDIDCDGGTQKELANASKLG